MAVREHTGKLEARLTIHFRIFPVYLSCTGCDCVQLCIWRDYELLYRSAVRLPRERERESEGRGTVEYRAGGEITIFKASKKKKSLSIYLRTELIQFPSSMKQYLYHCSKICTFLFSSFVKKKKKKNLFHYFLFCKCERSKML